LPPIFLRITLPGGISLGQRITTFFDMGAIPDDEILATAVIGSDQDTCKK